MSDVFNYNFLSETSCSVQDGLRCSKVEAPPFSAILAGRTSDLSPSTPLRVESYPKGSITMEVTVLVT